MSKLMVLVGPPGSGKSTLAKKLESEGVCRINQDSQGKEYYRIFQQAIVDKRPIIVDRMNFNKQQRNKFLEAASGYDTEIVVLHESYETCLERCMKRDKHPTISTEADAKKALDFFFKNYERVDDSEANHISRIWPEGYKPYALVCDLDGTLYNIEHRLKYVRGEGRKNWPMFFAGIKDDKVNAWCAVLLERFTRGADGIHIVLYSGRGAEYRASTAMRINEDDVLHSDLFMRMVGDYRRDDVVKEIILDFEILTRYEPYIFIDDRPSVCRMWRKRGYTVLQCNDKEF